MANHIAKIITASIAVHSISLPNNAAYAAAEDPVKPDTMAVNKKPANVFDLSHWKITLPIDKDGDKKPDEITVKKIKKYSHPDFFYLNGENELVFASPNKAQTTKNSSNTRSELRYMLRGSNTRLKTHGPENNFAVKARRDSDKFGSIGGKMSANLRVDHVARNAANPNIRPAYSLVIGQIHAVKYDKTSSGFGYGNEPLKIYYKKWPGHKTGSVFWTYERNLAKKDPKRKDIAYPVFGETWESDKDPADKGIALGEDFGYTVNVHQNIMYLTFKSAKLGTVKHKINLANNRDANGKIDNDDNPYSYGGDSLYFKAGVYNQCSTQSKPGFWYAGCAGTGNWATDKANGDYAQATFTKLIVENSTAEE